MGTKIRLDDAMKRQDGKAAVFYGERLVKKYTNKNGEIEYTDVIVRLAKAYELDGQHQKAKEMFQRYKQLEEELAGINIRFENIDYLILNHLELEEQIGKYR